MITMDKKSIKLTKEEYTELAVRIAEVRETIAEYLKNTDNKLQIIKALELSGDITRDLVDLAEFDLRDYIDMDEMESDQQEYIS